MPLNTNGGAGRGQGRKPIDPSLKKKGVNTKIDPNVLNRLREYSRVNGIPMSNIIENALTEYLSSKNATYSET